MRYWSISWRTAIGRDVNSDVRLIRALTVDFQADDKAVIASSDISRCGTRFEATGEDGWLLLKPTRRLKRGWYRIDLAANLPKPARPLLYFNFGQGFQERFACPLHDNGGKFSAFVRAYKPTLSLRLDPTDHPASFVLENLSLRRTKVWEQAWLQLRQLGSVIAATMHSPALWRENLANLRSGYWSTRGFVPLPARFACGHRKTPYQQWIETQDYDPVNREHLKAAVAALENKPLISILMPVFNTPGVLLDQAIASVMQQVYPHWELCIADDCSTLPHVRTFLQRWAARDPRIKVTFRTRNGHISAATNSCFQMASGDWIALLDHDDVLPEQALAEIALAINRHPEAQLIYSDEDKIDEKGQRFDPHFKPDFSIDLLRSMNFINHLSVHRAENIRALSGWREGFEGSQDYDLMLRVVERIPPDTIHHVPKVLYHWRTVQGSTAKAGSEKSYAFTNGLKALQEHLRRCQLSTYAEPLPDVPYFRVRYQVPDPAPLVSLIVPTHDAVDLLQTSIGSILQKTTYPNYEILIVDNGSEKPQTFRFFDGLSREHPNIRVLRYEKEFNFSAINNFAVRQARGSLIGLMNNDIEVITPDWLDEMVSHAVRPEIGCVGAKLYYPNGSVQHAGVILGIGGVAGHAHKYSPRAAPGYFSRLKVQQNLSAVTAACLLVRREIYRKVGGLEEDSLAVAFNDVDFCLKVRAAGYLNVFTPFAELYHHESISRGREDTPEKIERFNREVLYMRARWGSVLDADPFYSPNLTLQREDFSLRL